jgi:cation transport regulator ChaC
MVGGIIHVIALRTQSDLRRLVYASIRKKGEFTSRHDDAIARGKISKSAGESGRAVQRLLKNATHVQLRGRLTVRL